MRLKEINIQRYGPLKPIEWELDKGINPIYGLNQSGKTLIVEALLEIFAGKESSLPESVTRVDELPEGYIVIEESGNEVKVTIHDPLCEKLDIGVQELMNTLVVRNTDLQIQEASSFYRNVTDKITGLWTNSIQTIDAALRDLGRLTRQKLYLSNSEDYHKAKEQKEKAEQLEADIGNYLEKAREEAVSDLEYKKLRLEGKKKGLEKKRRILEFFKLSKTYKKAKKRQKELKKLPPSETISELEKQLTRGKELQKDKPYYERLLEYGKYIGLFSLLGNGIGFGCFLLLFHLWDLDWSLGWFLPLSLGIGLFSSFLVYYWGNTHLDEIQNKTKEIKNDAKKIGISPSTDSEKFFQELSNTIKQNERKRDELQSSLDGRLGVIRDLLNVSEDVGIKETFDQASREIRERKQELPIEDTQYESATLREVKTKLSDVKEKQSEVVDTLEEIKDKLEDHEAKLENFRERADRLDFQEFLGHGLDVQVENLAALRTLKRKLRNFIEKIEEDKKSAEIAVKIFRVLESEEEEKISELFGEESNTSKIFKEITDGKYERVEYDYERGEIFVVSADGKKRFPSRELSGSQGTLGQLYLAVRMGLAQKILNQAAFFILDDAFTFSDPTRRERQYGLMQELTSQGWQLLYLTSDPKIAKDLANLSGNEIHKLTKTYI